MGRRTKPTTTPVKSQILYTLFGPTTLHLKHEFTLLVALTLLTTASLYSLYRRSFGTVGDFQLIFLSFVWLSRYLIVRILATVDDYVSIFTAISTTRVMRGWASRIITRYVCAGQYFDAPPLDALAAGGGGGGYSGRSSSGGGDGGDYLKLRASYSSYLRDSFVHDWIVGPLTLVWGFFFARSKRGIRKNGGRSKPNSSLTQTSSSSQESPPSSSVGTNTSNSTSSTTKAASSAFYHTIDKYLDYIPPAQMSIALLTTLSILSILCMTYQNNATSSLAMMQQQLAFAAAGGFSGGGAAQQGTRLHYNQALSGYHVHPHGMGVAGSPHERFIEEEAAAASTTPSLWKVMFALMWVGTLSSLVVYGRVLLPFPDLAAGSNVLKAVRAEARHYGSGGGKLSKPKNNPTDTHLNPWAEHHYKSINLENRFRLHCKVIFLRIIENIILCSVIPQSEFACRVTGHCDSAGVVSWAAGGGGLGGGYTGTIMVGSVRKNATMFDFIIHDRGTSIIITLSVVLITALLLLGQVTTLDRTYLAIMGYISGEWSNNIGGGGGSNSQRGKSKGGDNMGGGGVSSSSSRRYKKSDLSLQSSSSSLSSSDKNRSNNPFDMYLRASHEMYRNELGHVSTSNVICYASYIHTAQLVLVGCVIVLYHSWGYNYGALVLTFLASFISLGGLVNIGLVVGNDGELENIAEEIATPVQEVVLTST